MKAKATLITILGFALLSCQGKSVSAPMEIEAPSDTTESVSMQESQKQNYWVIGQEDIHNVPKASAAIDTFLTYLPKEWEIHSRITAYDEYDGTWMHSVRLRKGSLAIGATAKENKQNAYNESIGKRIEQYVFVHPEDLGKGESDKGIIELSEKMPHTRLKKMIYSTPVYHIIEFIIPKQSK